MTNNGENRQIDYRPTQRAPFSIAFRLKCAAWSLVRCALMRFSPNILRGFRRFLLRCFGVKIAPTASIGNSAIIDFPWNLEMGDRASVKENTWVHAVDKITIGDDTCVSRGAQLITGTHDITDKTFSLVTKPIVIGKGAWIAVGAIILPGVNVGDFAVVGAG